MRRQTSFQNLSILYIHIQGWRIGGEGHVKHRVDVHIGSENHSRKIEDVYVESLEIPLTIM